MFSSPTVEHATAVPGHFPVGNRQGHSTEWRTSDKLFADERHRRDVVNDLQEQGVLLAIALVNRGRSSRGEGWCHEQEEALPDAACVCLPAESSATSAVRGTKRSRERRAVPQVSEPGLVRWCGWRAEVGEMSTHIKGSRV